MERKSVGRCGLFIDLDGTLADSRTYGPAEGAYELFEALTARSIPVAVVTAASEAQAWRWLHEHRLDGHVRLVIGGDTVSRGKPHPEPYLTALTEVGCDAAHSFAIEDTRGGAAAAMAAGLATWIICSTDDAPEVPGVQGYIRTLREALAFPWP